MFNITLLILKTSPLNISLFYQLYSTTPFKNLIVLDCESQQSDKIFFANYDNFSKFFRFPCSSTSFKAFIVLIPKYHLQLDHNQKNLFNVTCAFLVAHFPELKLQSHIEKILSFLTSFKTIF